MISEITLATTNKGKVSEFERAFENFKILLKLILLKIKLRTSSKNIIENRIGALEDPKSEKSKHRGVKKTLK